MFTLRRHSLISPEMLKYIRDTTNKSLEKYTNKPRFVIPDKNDPPDKKDPPDFFLLLPFVSLISFLAGYKFCKLIK
jgi:hypothetical protein